MTRSGGGSWFDSHCHLHLCDDPPEVVAERARAAGVGSMLCAATDVASSRVVAALRIDGVYGAVGVHPNDADGWSEQAEAEIETLIPAPHVVAVGETGLDFYRDRVPPSLQISAFTAQIEMALRHDLALVIHTRDSLQEALEILGSQDALPRFVFHCWSGTEVEIGRAVDLGAYISFAGNVSFKSAEPLRRSAAAVPEDRLLVETDSPYLAPVPHRGRPNEPAYVVDVGVAVAEARDETPENVATISWRNAVRLFGL